MYVQDSLSYSVQAWYVSKPTSEALIVPFLDQNLLAATKQSGMFCRPRLPHRTCAIAASPSGHSQDCFLHRPSHFLLQTTWHSELPRKLPGEKPTRTNVFPLWFVPEGSHNTVQTHQISVRGGKYLARLCMFTVCFLFFITPSLLWLFSFAHSFFFFFFYPGNLIFILRATEFVGKPILHTQWIFISILL